MTEPCEVELWPCGYIAKCSAFPVPPARRYHPALSRQPGAARPPDMKIEGRHPVLGGSGLSGMGGVLSRRRNADRAPARRT